MMRRLLCALLAAVMTFSLAGCGAGTNGSEKGDGGKSAALKAGETKKNSPTARSGDENAKPFDKKSVKWVDWTGTVEHLFFHPVVAYPSLAFDGDSEANGIDDFMVTAGEYEKILQSVYEKGYVLVDINQIWHEGKNAAGASAMVRSELKVPEGKKPMVFSFDDVNYYPYMITNGFTYQLIVGDNGQIWSYGKDPQGKTVYSQDLDAVTILDKFCRAHPDFSPTGARGCLSLTGYCGILGYRTQTEKGQTSAEFEKNRQKERQAVKPVIRALKDEGWTFGSHTWGHIRLGGSKSMAEVAQDTTKWKNEVGSLVGPTDVLFYPHGERPDGDDWHKTGPIFRYLQSQGFRVFCSVGAESFSYIKKDICAVICDRLHPDGTTLRHFRNAYLKFYDAKDVMDLKDRPKRSVGWQ